ncbi:MAG: membrane protein insertion efficiency factor YidD [Clostridiales bacterium]|nr:membrane protein insertion efficiency factor YidD [Clostridiales bacterium]
MRRAMLWIIRGYRTYISPMRPPACRFIPTCSAYALEAIERFGALRGGILALRRLSKCHPFHRQPSIAYDPVPDSWPPPRDQK